MKLDEYSSLDAVALAELVERKDVTPRELGELALQAVSCTNCRLNGVIQTYPDRLERATSPRQRGSLYGVPMLNKDLYAEQGERLEMGSLLAKGMVASEDANLIVRLRFAGLNTLGRTATPELGLASVTESRIAGVTRNPWRLDRTPGGSSGGSAAMVAAGVVPLATGGDAGGSIRSPAAHCGLVGLKPTRARISSGPNLSEPFGALAVDFVVTRSVRDSAIVLDAIHGMMPGDAYGVPTPRQPFANELHPPDDRLRIAYATTTWSGRAAAPEAREAVERVLAVLQSCGHPIEEAKPALDDAAFWKATLDVWCANTMLGVKDLAMHMQRIPGPDNLQSSTWAFYERGGRVTLADVNAALVTFNGVNRSIGTFFQAYDVLITPTCMSAAPLIGAVQCDPKGPVDVAVWSERMNAIDAFLPMFNVSGNPAISLPLHWSVDGLPVGVQLVSRFGEEAVLFQLAALLEEALPWRHRRPPVHVSRLAAEDRQTPPQPSSVVPTEIGDR